MTTRRRPPFSPPAFLALLALTLFFVSPSALIAVEATDQAATIAADRNTAGPCKNAQATMSPTAGDSGNKEQETGKAAPEEKADIRAMKQRYGQDPTGVRARLGMCRGGKGGQGGGPHRRFRGGNRWNPPQ